MTSLDPLKSVISIGNVDDTSLAVPSENQCSSGNQRVLEQVQSLRRTKSRKSTTSSSRSGSSSFSPTSPSYEFVFADPLKTQLTSSNGSVFFGNGLSKRLSFEKSMKQQVVNNSKESTVRRNPAAAAFQYEKRSYATLGTMAVSQPSTSRSEHDLARRRTVANHSSVPLQRLPSSKGTMRAERPSSQFIAQGSRQSVYTSNGTFPMKSVKLLNSSQPDGPVTHPWPVAPEITTKTREVFGSNGNSGVADITMNEAVSCLSSNDETHQHCGASYIQHNTFINDHAKEEVLKLNGIPPLVALLRSHNSLISETAAAALRNLSFKSNSSKEAIHRRGLTEVVALLKETDSLDLQKQLTGLLWNLSSADELKPDLLKSALPVLMERVILPYTTGPDQTNSNNQDPEVFYHATGCLRNLSSAKQNHRQVMRKCRGLVDSLVSYIEECVEAGKPDDKSVENCVCILHNLTFQLEAEAATLFSKITALSKTQNRSSSSSSQDDAAPIGCFSPQSKAPEQERQLDYPVVEDPHPTGAGLLFHSKTLLSYLNLLDTSQRADTQEACCGALHNLTAHEGIVSKVMGHTIVKKLNGLQVIAPLLKSDKANLQKSAVALVGNLTNNPGLHSAVALKCLPELGDIINAGTEEGNESDDTLSMVCQATNCLVMKAPDIGKKLLNRTTINSLGDLSQNNYLPKTSKAASLFLCNLWSDKDLQSFLKKQRMGKPLFLNDYTKSALQLVQDGH
ncbi:plakophilin-1 [Hippoglossus stenolepis]|uniref:plakophilin-1 n=1 Tax=Hippoglossus stenolepis TaxID=195615 RepID=UPI00159C7BE4|nr:plakophilin-1 [Hippoglossus stenolepis]